MDPEYQNIVKRLSIISAESGIELYNKNYEPSFFLENDNQLISGFLSALIQFSQEVVKDEIQEIVFANSQLCLKRLPDLILLIMAPLGTDRSEVYPILDHLSKNLKTDKEISELLLGGMVTPEITKKIDNFVSHTLKQEIVPSLPPLRDKRPKVVIAGLRKSGKTTIIRKFFDSWNEEQLQSIRPTIDYSIFNSFVEVMKTKLTIFDLGGQTQYVNQHLADKTKWRGATAILFLVDMHKPDEFNEAYHYLERILEILRSLGETPFIALVGHKYDPDQVSRLQPNLQSLLRSFKGLFKWPRYSVFLSSIYDDSLYLAFMRTLVRIIPRDLFQNILESAIFFETQNEVWKTLADEADLEQDSPEFQSRITRLSAPYGENLANSMFTNWLTEKGSRSIQKSSLNPLEVKISDMPGGIRADVKMPEVKENLMNLAVIEGLLTGLANVFGFSKVMRFSSSKEIGSLSASWGLYEF
ncbi:MAG: ADP-ribosylation factor-like protein [Candidatus Hodarchaeales archaeon]|jgi:GTPase SAR1 family protein